MRPVFIAGIDPSSSKLAVVTTTDDISQIDMRCKALNKTNKQRACAMAYDFIEELIDDYKDAELFLYLEEPVYVRGKGSVQAMKVQCFIDGAIMTCAEHRNVSLTQVANTVWKKEIVLNGWAKKPEIAAAVQRFWPAAFTQAEGDQDLLDAACINRYGKILYDRSVRIRRRGTQLPKIARSA